MTKLECPQKRTDKPKTIEGALHAKVDLWVVHCHFSFKKSIFIRIVVNLSSLYYFTFTSIWF